MTTTKNYNIPRVPQCPLVGTVSPPPPPFSRKRVYPSPLNQKKEGGGANSPLGEGVGESQFQRLEKKLSNLFTLWFPQYYFSRQLYNKKCRRTNRIQTGKFAKFLTEKIVHLKSREMEKFF
jgi:hypothetical protein